MKQTNTILFISHNASKSGAPILLLDFIDWFKENSRTNFKILLNEGGELESAFRQRGETYIFTEYLGDQYELIRLLKDITLIYSNTIANGYVLELLSQLHCPVISHVHELEYAIRIFRDHFTRTKRYTTYWIAGSRLIEALLSEQYNIPENTITVIPDFVSSSVLEQTDEKRGRARNEVLGELRIDKDAQLVFGCGSVEWRKGPDLFVQVADKVLKQTQKDTIHFAWIGAPLDENFLNQVLYEAELLQISKNVHFIGFKDRLTDYLLAGEVFLLTSREDPFPLAALLAASAERPIVCFDQVTGITELVESDAGYIVPFMDIQGMADKVIYLLEDEKKREHLGKRGREKVKGRYTVESAGAKIVDVLHEMFAKYPMDELRSETLIRLHEVELEFHSTRNQLEDLDTRYGDLETRYGDLESEYQSLQNHCRSIKDNFNSVSRSEALVIGKTIVWFPAKIKRLVMKLLGRARV